MKKNESIKKSENAEQSKHLEETVKDTRNLDVPSSVSCATVETTKIFGVDSNEIRKLNIREIWEKVEKIYVPQLKTNCKKMCKMRLWSQRLHFIEEYYVDFFKNKKDEKDEYGEFEPYVRELYILVELNLITNLAENFLEEESETITERIINWMTQNYKNNSGVITEAAKDAPIINDLYKMYIESDKKCSIETVEACILKGDFVRAALPEHDKKLLTEVNRGSWDLWEDELEDKQIFECSSKVYARNPKVDIKENGIVAIDFGTKSTVVVFNDDNYNPMLMNIGNVDRKTEVSLENANRLYENPTIMHFVNIESFMKKYKERKGRPYTLWNDINISHTAEEKFRNAESTEGFYSYLRDLKQWAGKTTEGIRIRQENDGGSVSLEAFENIDLDGFNPIEIYAYYLGLYINRMDMRRIFLDYYLSFPVTYKNEIRRKILESFERGIKKSLPVTILKDDELMKRFRINGDISEPSAYAACALTEYHIQPGEKEEECSYGVFDFGGGTTDFDFGLWRKSTKLKYDYEIVDFEEYAGGKDSLGGENLLKKLAFEIFRENIKFMREGNYAFTRAPMVIMTPDVENCVELSETANRNMCNLMERIRPFWELQCSPDDLYAADFGQIISRVKGVIETDDVFEKFVNDFKEDDNAEEAILNMIEDCDLDIRVDLFKRSGERKQSEHLTTSLHKLMQSIIHEINDGIENFIASFINSFGVYEKAEDIKSRILHIFLAGNSSKSPFVRLLFAAKLKVLEEKIRKERTVSYKESLFVLYPPLGTDAAYEKMQSMGIKVPAGNDRLARPTCKTGVAFGLFACRKGGRIKRTIKRGEETSFAYFIGYSIYNDNIGDYCFRRFENDNDTIKGKPAYNKWYEFIDADEEVFEICCTSLPIADFGSLVVTNNPDVFINRCRLDKEDTGEDLMVFIRAISPTVLEYTVSEPGKNPDEKKNKVYRKELGRNK